jgi:hypothetical protein
VVTATLTTGTIFRIRLHALFDVGNFMKMVRVCAEVVRDCQKFNKYCLKVSFDSKSRKDRFHEAVIVTAPL